MDVRSETQQGDALSEGRRIYVGNLLYTVKPNDVEDMLRQSGFGESFEKLHISVDPVSGRNPGYCFVEFTTREEADRALKSLPNTHLFNRPVKVGPCHPKTPAQSRWRGSRGAEYKPTFQRWGDWKGGDENANPDSQPRAEEQGPRVAMQHLDMRKRRGSRDKTQLFIGGLDMMINQEHHDTEMQKLLEGFEYVAIGKRITPRAETRAMPGNHHYCFVDFSSVEEAERAAKALHGAPFKGDKLRVGFTRSKWTDQGWKRATDGPRESSPSATGGQQAGQDGRDRRERSEKQRAIMTANSWRSGASAN
ncbi:hypothetical protein C8A03DRAFT_13260 [Achaetomium macrosporum]|uniref:RRM domain-containing protein n=1 Tax=Achaetomium macrosporum TaxID=79813 RepID=A0AAN7HD36_9PEZI|nr:hypothetical protein C8A03DRAFT_13260 [Achaetomium macrosporum]